MTTITTTAELDALPEDAIIRDNHGIAVHRRVTGWWTTTGMHSLETGAIAAEGLPATVLHHPDTPPAARLAAVEAALSNHPRVCDLYPDEGPFACGWKSAVADIEAVLSAAPTNTTKEADR